MHLDSVISQDAGKQSHHAARRRMLAGTERHPRIDDHGASGIVVLCQPGWCDDEITQSLRANGPPPSLAPVDARRRLRLDESVGTRGEDGAGHCVRFGLVGEQCH